MIDLSNDDLSKLVRDKTRLQNALGAGHPLVQEIARELRDRERIRVNTPSADEVLREALCGDVIDHTPLQDESDEAVLQAGIS